MRVKNIVAMIMIAGSGVLCREPPPDSKWLDVQWPMLCAEMRYRFIGVSVIDYPPIAACQS